MKEIRIFKDYTEWLIQTTKDRLGVADENAT